jgi:hypothetical protein
MALDARHRSSIYEKLVPILGDDDANALMTEFPSIEADELVTKQFLRAELADLRTELRGDIAGLRLDMASLETRLTLRIGAAMAAQTAVLAALKVLT